MQGISTAAEISKEEAKRAIGQGVIRDYEQRNLLQLKLTLKEKQDLLKRKQKELNEMKRQMESYSGGPHHRRNMHMNQYPPHHYMDRPWKGDRGSRHGDNYRGGMGRDSGRHRGDRGGDTTGGHSSAQRANTDNHDVRSAEDA